MAKSASQIGREVDAIMIAQDAELELTPAGIARGRALRKKAGAPIAALMGYTRSKKPVHAPTRAGAPDTNDVVVFQKTKAKFPGWTRADFMDAANLYDHAAVALKIAGNHKGARDLERWSNVFWDIGGRWLSQDMEALHGERPRPW